MPEYWGPKCSPKPFLGSIFKQEKPLQGWKVSMVPFPQLQADSFKNQNMWLAKYWSQADCCKEPTSLNYFSFWNCFFHRFLLTVTGTLLSKRNFIWGTKWSHHSQLAAPDTLEVSAKMTLSSWTSVFLTHKVEIVIIKVPPSWSIAKQIMRCWM